MTITINGTTGIAGVDGSASTPAFKGNDADSGFYINSANEPNASVNGTATWSAASTFGFKNRIINGAMVIDQRNAGASITPTDGQYSVDRWKASLNVSSKFSLQQSSTAPAGFINSLLVTSLSSYSVGSGEVTGVQQAVEGLNVADLGWGTASAATVTLSFWVRSSLTGTFGGSLRNSAANRSYPFSYTISSANTWEQKSVTIAGDTSGTWLTTSGVGIQLYFAFGAGSTFSSTANSWQAGNYISVTGATSVVGTNGATFYITGVQLEKGSTATSFDYRPYGTELALCQRYFWRIDNTGSYTAVASGVSTASTNARVYVKYPTDMRASPTMSFNGLTAFDSGSGTVSSISSTFSGTSTAMLDLNVSSGLTTGRGCVVFKTNGSASEYLQATAEL